MTKEFEDGETLLVSANFLNLLLPHQFIETSKRRIPGYKNFSWWMRCYPNGADDSSKGYLSVYLYTSVNGIEITKTITVLRSDIKTTCTSFCDYKYGYGWANFASHAALQQDGIIKNGVFVIKCELNLKIPDDLKIDSEDQAYEDSCIVKLDRKVIETYKPWQRVVGKKQTVGDITWWIEYYPCGFTAANKEYVRINLHLTGGPVTAERSYGILIDNLIIHFSSIQDYKETGSWGCVKTFSHDQIRQADHENGFIDLVCKVKFTKPNPPKPITTKLKPTKQSVNGSIIAEMLECQLDDNEIAEFDSTPKEFVNGSDKHQWRLKWFPAGDSFGGKKHISLFVEASTTETKTVTLSGVIRIAGTTFEKKFNMLVETDSISAFPKLISHEELRRIGGIVDNKVTITCNGTFHTFRDLSLT